MDVEGPQLCKQQKQADSHGRVTDPGHDKGLARCVAVVRVFIPEADQEITAQAYPFPSQVQQHQIVTQYQHQHGSDEQVHVGEESAIGRVVNHETGGVEMNQKTDAGDDQHHYK